MEKGKGGNKFKERKRKLGKKKRKGGGNGGKKKEQLGKGKKKGELGKGKEKSKKVEKGKEERTMRTIKNWKRDKLEKGNCKNNW